VSHPRAIDHEAVYPHSPERVWRALVDADELAEWLMPTDFAPELGRRFVLETGDAHIGTSAAAVPLVGRVRRHRGVVRAHPRR